MNTRKWIISLILCGIVLGIYLMVDNFSTNYSKAQKIYYVYLDGVKLGAIANKEELYDKINIDQQQIKDKYNVKKVYPPNGLEVVEDYSYSEKVTNVNSIYEKISKEEDFTIYGYEITVGKSDTHDEYKLYVLNKQVFKDALEQFILTFIDKEDYKNYMNNEQGLLEDIGTRYTNMGIKENITIKRSYIGSNEHIYEDSQSLVQTLLFGFDYKEKSYTVKDSDTIESISTANKLNVKEFLIANPKFDGKKDIMLNIGDEVNITLINPLLTFSYQIQEMEEVEYKYQTNVERDETKPGDFYEVTTPGVNGLSIVTSHYDVVNGEPMNNVEIDNEEVIRETVDQIITKGVASSIWGNQSIDDSNLGWAWPTENHYFKVTSEYEYRWGRFHQGIDIAGTGDGSNIYSSNAGTVVSVNNTCEDYGYYGSRCGSGYGNYVIIAHENGYYTTYAHLKNNITVKVGQQVGRKQLIGYMGNSGSSTGTHLHYAVSNGSIDGNYFNPRKLY